MSDDRAKRLAQLRQAYESGILDEDTYRAAVVALEPGGDIEATIAGATSCPSFLLGCFGLAGRL